MTIDGMDELNKRLNAITDTRKLLGQLGLLAVRYSKELVPRKTGNLGRTIRLGSVSETEVNILAGGMAGVGYAKAVEFGSRPHVIRPRNRRVLAWGGNRRLSGSLRSGARATNFATFVNHPGTKARPYLRPGAERALQQGAVQGVVKAWNEAA